MVVVLVCLFLMTALSTAQAVLNVNVDVASTTPLNHFWKECVGSSHALLGTRRDWQEHLVNATRDLGFKRVRFHGVLDDDMSILLDRTVDEKHDEGYVGRQSRTNYFNVFTVYDYMLELGVRPLVELSFMPRALQGCQPGTCHYAFNDPPGSYKGYIMPPDDFNDWHNLVLDFVQHLVERYGIDEVKDWYFEVWNELWGMPFPQDYMALYNASAVAIKSVDERLMVGGPATMQVLDIAEFIAECKNRSLPFDFVSTHLYPTDPNCVQPSTKSQADCFSGQLQGVYDIVSQTGKPTLITEYNDGLGSYNNTRLNHRDKAFAAGFILHNIPRLTNLTAMSWWTFSDIFEEGGLDSTPFANKYGLQTVHGVAKPAYRAFELLNGAGSYRAASDANDIVTVMATTTDAHDGTGLRLYMSNFQRPDLAVIPDATVTVAIQGLSNAPSTAQLYHLDDDHLTPFDSWTKIGSPLYPTKAQLQQMHAASQLVMETVQVTSSGGVASVTVDIKAYAGAVVIF